MLDWLKNCFVDLADTIFWIFIKSFFCENCVNILAEVHPFDSFFPIINSANIINDVYLIELIISYGEI